MIKPKTIVVLGSGDILSYSLPLFLGPEDGWEVVCIADQAALEGFIQSADVTQTDIVAIHQKDQASQEHLARQLFHDLPSLELVVINLEGNCVDVYCKQLVLIHEASDLIAVIRKEHSQ